MVFETDTTGVSQVLRKVKNRRKQRLEDGENSSMQLDKEDTQRKNLNSKCLSVTTVLKYIF